MIRADGFPPLNNHFDCQFGTSGIGQSLHTQICEQRGEFIWYLFPCKIFAAFTCISIWFSVDFHLFFATISLLFSANAVAAGTVTFNQIVVSGCIQEDLVLRFSAHHLTTVTSAPFDVFTEPNMPNITGSSSNLITRVIPDLLGDFCEFQLLHLRGAVAYRCRISSEFYCRNNRSVSCD
jgi:hypothetical protein